jgi:membrane associated rhomboid family serine protease
MPTPPETSAPDVMHCYRHADRETLISCSNCGRPICTSCMTTAAVGIRCPECARGDRSAASAGVQRLRARAGADAVIATTAIVLVNVLVFLVEIAQAGQIWNVTSAEIIDKGAVYGPAIADGEWYRLVTGGFLHASLVHIGFNMYLLWILGGALERYAGSLRFAAIYLTAVLWGSVGALVASPDSHTIGASGGVFGLMAALYLLERQRGVALLGGSVGMLLLLNLVITFAFPGISIGGHIGGIIGGAAAGFVLSGYGRGHLAYGRIGAPGWGVMGALIAGALIVGVAVA